MAANILTMFLPKLPYLLQSLILIVFRVGFFGGWGGVFLSKNSNHISKLLHSETHCLTTICDSLSLTPMKQSSFSTSTKPNETPINSSLFFIYAAINFAPHIHIPLTIYLRLLLCHLFLALYSVIATSSSFSKCFVALNYMWNHWTKKLKSFTYSGY